MNGLPIAKPPWQSPRSLPAVVLLNVMVMAVITIAACSSGSGGSGNSKAIVQSAGDMPQPAQATIGQGCSQLSSLPEGGIEAVDNSLTPAADPHAERLSREASGEFVATHSIYTRVLADLSALQSAFPTRTAARSSACYRENQLIIKLSADAEAQRRAGSYSNWDKLNNKLRLASDAELISGIRLLSFTGHYNMPRTAQQYEQLAGVEFAEPDSFRGDGDDACLEIRQSDYLYIFDNGNGDCPSGCISHQYDGFSVDASGNIEDLGSYSTNSTEALPSWFADAKECRSFL